ncbi:T9SS type A sorting domain-containing protein [Flavobacterium sandaracinum]|uniref:T9SS type A sorting domain-containing protein n=1 Tax=Flavobacterium sandaracinum TaxID=2541733 RepID=A0A4R5D0Z3_9FLAO|nr:T9SS type A sorting domain-containing protein [Flavobacterium sandaracinum]TDE05917.1 T9SS type A sorting domain-containing protein [Flavobacterium sandaracinum]
MKKITLFIFLLFFSIGFSQNAPITFENGEFGSTWTFASFENGSGAGYSKVANPFPGGINSSATVGKFIAGTTASGAAPYAGFETAHASGANGIGTFTLSASNSTIKIMVYKTVISDVAIKFAIADGGAQPEIKVANTKINEWEELTFDFSGKIGLFETINIDQIILFLDFNARTAETTSYFDNVTFSAKTAATAPTVAAPTPPARTAADVKSLYSDAYAVYKAGDWCKCWGQSTDVTDELIATNNTKKLTNFNYQGITLPGAEVFDLSDMTTMHVDLWSSNATSVKINLINPGPVESGVTLTIAAGWNSFDLILNASNFPGINFNNVFQMSLSSTPAGTTVYLDNFYFYKSTVVVAPTAPTVAAPTPPARTAADVKSIYSDAYAVYKAGDWCKCWGQSTDVTDELIATNNTRKLTNFNYQGITLPGAEVFDLSDMTTMHVDLWSSSATSVKINLINPGPVESGVTLTIAAGWNSFDLILNASNFPGINFNNVFQMSMSSTPAGTTVYLDNFYFYKSTVVVAPTAPTVAAPTPPARTAADVKSIYSDAYAVYKAGDWCKCWGQSTDVTDELIATNNTRKLTNFNYQGITLPGAEVFDLSDMATMHVDLWSSSATSVKINLINPGPVESGVTLTIAAGWNSFDLILNASNFPGINFGNVFQMSLSSTPAGTTVYLDNFYFYKGTLGIADFETSNVKMYPNPVNSTLTIDANSTIEKVAVYTILGQEVLVENPKSNSTTIQTSELSKGVYIVKTNVDGKVITTKIIKK